MFKIYKNLYNYLRVMDKELSLKLTNEEEKIFKMLKTYRDQIGLQTVLRVAGGWVRDKVLGSESKDIDIALDNMKGEQFVNSLINHAKQKGQQVISGFGVTKFNPDQSKHLETATAKVYNHWIDFVNFRSEKYNEDSRIPSIEIGTPLQDAQRRDFTINSMFYNLDTEQVQDWIGKGLQDLENKILRTPLQPYVTFKDDPLRILRCLRFKSRLGFEVDEKIYEAIKKPQIKQALLKKVSKERVGIQLAGLLKAKQYMLGLQDMKNYGLWNIVFSVPEESDLFQKKQLIQQIPQISLNCTQLFLKSLAQNAWITSKDLICQETQEEDMPKQKSKKKPKLAYQQKQLQFLILLSSLTYVYSTYSVKVGKNKQNLQQNMIKSQLKYSAKHAKFAMHFAQSVNKLAQIKSNENIFQLIRWLRFAEQKWQLAIHFLQAYWSIQKYEPHINLFQLREDITKKNLANCYLTESPIDGTFLTKKGIKGPVISKILQNAIIWRIINPGKPNEQFSKEFQQNTQFFMSEKTYK